VELGSFDEGVDEDDEGLLVLVGEPVDLLVEAVELRISNLEDVVVRFFAANGSIP